MSGDVQPRKRKDKRRKRDAFERKSEGELSFSRQSSFQDDDESSHGVHITKMGSEDVHLHVHEEHGTGGNWCAKIIFFSLMAVLLGLVGLIILENRGLADLDTPLSESRFSNYFDGWVEEHRDNHDEHDAVQASIEEHDEHDEPFEEEDDEENQSEVDDADAEADDDEHEDEAEDEDEESKADKDDDDDDGENATAEQTVEEDDDNDDDNEIETAEQTVEDSDDELNDENDDDEENDNNGGEVNDDDERDNDATTEDDDNDNGNENDNDDDEEEASIEPTRQTSTHASASNNDNYNGDDDDIFDEDDDDDDSFDNVIDNDAEELLILQQKAAQQAANAGQNQAESNEINAEDDDAEPEPSSWGASLAVKIGIGVALALVARLVLIRKNPNTIEEPSSEVLMKRRLTIATAEEHIPDDYDEELPPLDDEIKPKAPTGAQAAQQFDDDEDENDAAAFELFEQELRRANEHMMEENYAVALQAYAQLTHTHSHIPAAFLAQATALDRIAEAEHSNKMLVDAIEAYKRYLAFGQDVKNDGEYRAAAERCIERMRFLGYHLQAVPIHDQLIERFADEPKYRNQLSLTYLMMNRLDDVKVVAASTLRRWPSAGLAQLHYGFALKQIDKSYEKAVQYMQLGIDSNAPGTQEGFFYFTLGELLQRMGRTPEALQIYERGAALKLFPSVYQRSLYNEPNLRAQPFWLSHETGYEQQLAKLEHNWQAIRDEALALLSHRGYFEDEAENLRDTGNWQQYELYARGQRHYPKCQKAPITCGLVAQFEAASGCKRGQVKFSVMHGGTHVWPHCGPTNCRLRAHLGLVVPNGSRIRVAENERSWTEGKFLIFDDSFEHEVWHNGTSLRLVLIVDIYHPDLTHRQRQALTPI